MNASWYFLGAICCFVVRWMSWTKTQPAGVPLLSYWSDRNHIATNVVSLIVTIMTAGLWLNGMLATAADYIIPDEILPPGLIKVTYYFSGPAGFFVTMGARKLVRYLTEATGGDD